jgi:hypothetical protein
MSADSTIFAVGLIGVSALAAALVSAAPPTPAEIGVRVEKAVGDGRRYSQGSGVLIGDGLVLTAAHVLKYNPGDPKVTVVMGGWRVEGKLAALGGPDTVDVALVKVERAAIPLGLRDLPPAPICPSNPGLNQPVTVAALGQVSSAMTAATPVRPGADWTNMLSTPYHRGASGGGVFDARKGCLAGVLALEVSGRITPDAPFIDMTAFIPATDIAAFVEKYRAGSR